ncbi:cytochrome c oxidase subunit 4 isoform 1, mitochondrial [Schistocerca americana]|uniref:cytochrome c oxidase subunit 4 isoform 1, mitochondrial n=1 Tax=Schistocerca americana TaxID=7009 RepID=UPI001F4F7941|nr:cytochrome c oxidase subunit 4 isoform 1, mitochondrial [Schistocerca americana]XP_047001792.1 cytochrome c oxidase subunit 4 isoform 1, mitochondrial [Schistocerca americana]XP_047001794.1 cytochrome c oxidase subunit 4 isoform 1, mitochondrial [Schistocerca americana]XP_047001795.1 cytochrome c oxidase subunit 4 isoform 1, mitochondrial [Schistocerca americana]XP_047120175.1 cytochrome c oxidase subunit 4 isoform 1, mitochondrial [Schistocerca piceifrons]XP_047120176.1 cytochrome c oxidas
MASRLLASALRETHLIQKAGVASYRAKIGNREIVGYGFNGQPSYMDRTDFPMPAIRFKETTPDIEALRQKEKGDWRKLSIEEKKALYRASFCQTFAEMQAPTGEWKSIIGFTLIGVSLSLWIYMAMKLWVYKPLPSTFTEERREAQLRRMINLQVNPVEGLASKWDYEKNDWKK